MKVRRNLHNQKSFWPTVKPKNRKGPNNKFGPLHETKIVIQPKALKQPLQVGTPQALFASRPLGSYLKAYPREPFD